jgi:hypothetical protein
MTTENGVKQGRAAMHVLGGSFAAALLVLLSGCKPIPPTPPLDSSATPAAQVAPSPTAQPAAAAISPERKTYEEAVSAYNDFLSHPKGHVYHVSPKNRKDELCYLSAVAMTAALKVPEIAAATNANGEVEEWRSWVDIRDHALHCSFIDN